MYKITQYLQVLNYLYYWNDCKLTVFTRYTCNLNGICCWIVRCTISNGAYVKHMKFVLKMSVPLIKNTNRESLQPLYGTDTDYSVQLHFVQRTKSCQIVVQFPLCTDKRFPDSVSVVPPNIFAKIYFSHNSDSFADKQCLSKLVPHTVHLPHYSNRS